MPTFTVHEPPNPPADRSDRAEALAFVKDGFGWGAALFAPVWLIVHRLWWPLVGYVVASGLLEAGRMALPAAGDWITLAGIALHLVIGFEAGALRRWALGRRGWRTVAVVSGRTTADCERRFFEAWLPAQPVIAPAPAGGGSGGFGESRRQVPVIGALIGARS
jgi:hypothetical protein